jgi:DNA-nicking Smr family endonuclease
MPKLGDLKAVWKADVARREALAAAAKAEAARLKRAHEDQHLFETVIAKTGGLAARVTTDRVPLEKPKPPAIAAQQLLDDQAVLLASLSDEFDFTTLLDTDDALSFRRPGIGPDVLRKLRKGNWSIQAQLDLHGARVDDARQRLAAFIREAHKQGTRCIRIVHGKGLGSPGKTPVLKGKVQGWLMQKQEVIAFVQAKPSEGGAGALVVLLSPS